MKIMPIASLLKKALNDQKSGHIDSAERQYRYICNAHPEHPDAHNLLGCLLMDQEKYTEAEHFIQTAIQLKPDTYFFHYHLGLVYALQKKWQMAKSAFIKALECNPSHVESFNNLGIAYRNLKQYDRAIETFTKGLQHDNSNSDIHCNLGGTYSSIGDIKKAGNHLFIALKYAPTSPVYHREIANLYRKLNHLKKAEYHLIQSLKFAPNSVDTLNSYAVNLKNQGKLQEAYQLLNKVVQIKPDFWDVHSNILFIHHFMHEITPQFIFQAHVNYGQKLMTHFTIQKHSGHHKQTRIRIGYVSPDFKRHSVAYFMESILRNHDCSKFDIYCYANVMEPDEVTQRFQTFNVKWRDIYDIPDNDVIAQIKTDRIDILIDLAGHSANNRMPLFAQKPAPIQMTYLGYPNTTGLPSIDYRISDRCADPEELMPMNTEKLRYMHPCFLCYTPQSYPAVKKRTINKPDHILFGTFNTLAKINHRVIEVWAKILKELPHSKILLKNKSFTDLEIQAEVQNRFQPFGINKNRLIFKAYIDDPVEHLKLYQTIDIALDTFPYNGTTTTFEALWMGIPVIGLMGQSHVSRVTYSILSALGLSELVGRDDTEYIQKAIQLATDYTLMRFLNNHLRTMMQQSILTDGAAFTRRFEHLLIQSVETNWL
jgi:predicted O-linked N-acetylglucosamine transferase (SPINDLY family)